MSTRHVASWLAFCAILVAAVLFSWHSLDVRVARHFAGNIDRLNLLGRGFASAVLVGGEALVIAVLVIARLAIGKLPRICEAALVASVASLIAYTINDVVLKMLFGVPNPSEFLFGASGHAAHFFQGDRFSSFPSGHMALATSYAAAFARLYPKTLFLFAPLLAVAALTLVIGDWHFVSDVIAGTAVGGCAGLTAGELWIRHSKSLPLQH